MSSTYLGDIADDLLDVITGGLDQATTGRAAPSHAYVSHGQPTWADCCDGGLAAVYLDTTEDAVTHSELPQDRCIIIPTAHWVLEWARCVPTVDDETGWPDDEDLTTSAEDLLEDLWCVLTELYDRIRSGALGGNCGDVRVDRVEPAEPQGGCAGWRVRVSTLLNDAGPTGS